MSKSDLKRQRLALIDAPSAPPKPASAPIGSDIGRVIVQILQVVAAARRIDEICAAGCSLQAALEKIAEEEDDEISFSACSALVLVLRHARTVDLLNSLKPRIARNVKAQASAIATNGGGGSCLDPTEEELDELCGGL